eukprot:2036713-Pyramimonas_sp.AAC.1
MQAADEPRPHPASNETGAPGVAQVVGGAVQDVPPQCGDISPLHGVGQVARAREQLEEHGD